MALWLSAAAGCVGAEDGLADPVADGGGGGGDPGGASDASGPDGGAPLPPVAWARLAGNGSLQVVDISDDGRRIAFTSGASDLVDGDTNGQQDAFVFDAATRAVVRASLSFAGAQASCGHPARLAAGGAACSYAAALSGDGETVIFASKAADLVLDDQNGVYDLFARDLASGQTSRVNLGSDGAESDDESRPSAAVSRDGRYVAFYSLSSTFVADPGCAGVYLRDRETGTTSQVSLTASGGTDTGCVIWTTGGVSLAGDGATVAYAFRDGGIVSGVSDHYQSLFAREMASAASVLVSASSEGQPSDAGSDRPRLSADGRAVAFWSAASNLVAGDQNGAADVFVRDLAAGTTERVSLSSAGAESAGDCGEPSISGDGRFVAFSCARGGLVAGDQVGVAQVYVRDRQTGTTALVSRPPDGGAADGDSFAPAISGDGRAIAFSSEASNLYGGEADGRADLLIAPNPLAE